MLFGRLPAQVHACRIVSLRSRCGAFTWRGRAVRSNSPWRMPWFCAGARAARPRPPVRGASYWSPPPGGKPSAPPAAHNRFHPWRDNKARAIYRAATMEHPALVGISGFMINVLLQTLKAKPHCGNDKKNSRGDPRRARRQGSEGRKETPQAAPQRARGDQREATGEACRLPELRSETARARVARGRP